MLVLSNQDFYFISWIYITIILYFLDLSYLFLIRGPFLFLLVFLYITILILYYSIHLHINFNDLDILDYLINIPRFLLLSISFHYHLVIFNLILSIFTDDLFCNSNPPLSFYIKTKFSKLLI